MTTNCIINNNCYLMITNPNYSFSEQFTSSDRMNKLKNQTIYTDFKTHNKTKYCLPTVYPSYKNKYNIISGNLYCMFE